LPHVGVRFDGELRVIDPDRLAVAVASGIGPAKAFGFGLLSLALAR
ncbi:MAG: type I-E CRISPR-associated protein Cas6/Cse3/CasE, partial [Bacteroidota bacterium]